MVNLVCHIELFSQEQEIVILENNVIKGTLTAPLQDLQNSLVNYSLNEDVEKICLYGPEVYAQMLGGCILDTFTTQYNSKNLTVEVNGKWLNT